MVLCERIQERITRLASGVAIIRVGASTEVEMTEKKHRIEDALEAVSAAQAEGIIAGGGSTLYRIGRRLGSRESLGYDDWEMDHPDQRTAVAIMREATKAPLQIMCDNAGESFDLISRQLHQEGRSWDFTKEGVVDAYETGILDPVKVTKNAVLNAVSVAGTLITTDYAIVEG